MTSPAIPSPKGDKPLRTHTLKTWPEYFKAVASGAKSFEVRLHDRDFRVGDTLILQEYDPQVRAFTGQTHTATVTYLLPGGDFGVASNYCVMGLSRPP
jgi:hypothetical protein